MCENESSGIYIAALPFLRRSFLIESLRPAASSPRHDLGSSDRLTDADTEPETVVG